MSQEVKLPSLGESVEGGTVLEVLVKQGDHVNEEDPLLEIETDKATVEVPSPASGVIEEILVGKGDEIESGQKICVIGEDEGSAKTEDTKSKPKRSKAPKRTQKKKPNDEPSEPEPKAAPAEETSETAPEPEPATEESATAEEPEREPPSRPAAPTPPKAEPAKPTPRMSRAAPHVRRLARELGVDLDDVARAHADQVTEEDVKSHVRDALRRSGELTETRAELPDFTQWGEVERVPLGAVRRATAETVSDSWKSVPQVTHFDRAAIAGVEAFRARHGDRVGAEKISLTAILVCLAAEALKKFEAFNSSIDMANGELVLKRYFHVGVAVDTPRGLLVPVVRDVHRKGLVEVAEELAGLLDGARTGDLAPDDLTGATFTITNVGPIGGSHFTPLVVWPQVAILGVGAEQPALIDRDGEIAPARVLPLSLSYDHRAVDGADAARFTRWFAEALEDPLTMLLES